MKKVIVLVLFLFLFPYSAFSITNGFETMSFRPATDDGRYMGLWDSHVLGCGKWNLGTIFDYGYRSFQITQNGSRQSGVLDDIFIQHIYGSVGIIERWLEAGALLPVGWWVNYKNPDIAGSPWQNKIALGDIRLNLKTVFLSADDGGVGLALVPFIGLPTGKAQYFLGNGGISGGGNLVIEGKPNKIFSVALNAGVMGKRRYDFREMEKGNQLIGGLGVAVNASKYLILSAEASFKTRLSGPFEEKIETPVEAIGALKYAFADTGFVMSVAGRGGIIHGAEAPEFGALLGFGFDSSKRRAIVKKVVAPDASVEAVLHFAFNSIAIKNDVESAKLTALADAIREDKTKKIKIEGGADSVGTRAANEKIAKRRAEVGAWFLNMLGIDRSRMTLTTNLADKPAGVRETTEKRQADRKVLVGVVVEN